MATAADAVVTVRHYGVRPRRLPGRRAGALACLLSLMLGAAACGGVDEIDSDQPAPSQSPTASADGNGAPSPPAIDLTCSSGTTGLAPGGTELHGVATAFFGWRSGLWQQEDLRSLPTMTLESGRYYQAKSDIYVSDKASATTRITLLSPPNARLYFTDWANWARLGSGTDGPGQSRLIAAESSTAVNVPRCGEDSWGAPGMLLLEGPTCVTFRVTGQKPDWEVTRTVPFHTDRC